MKLIANKLLAVSAAAFGLVLTAPSALAQYQWREANGSMVYSDRPPPNGVNSVKMIKSPAAVQVPIAAANGATASAAGNATAPTLASGSKQLYSGNPSPKVDPGKLAADKALAEKIKVAAIADKAKETADAEKHAKDVARHCTALRDNQKLMESGQRVAKMGSNGERDIMTDADRQAKLAEIRKDLSVCK